MAKTPAHPRRQRLASRAGVVVTSIALPRTLHRRAALAAVRDGLALTELYRRAVAQWLAARRASSSRSTP
jgi:hypothetical protein